MDAYGAWISQIVISSTKLVKMVLRLTRLDTGSTPVGSTKSVELFTFINTHNPGVSTLGAFLNNDFYYETIYKETT